ncbi:hypothetical protein Ade02nite_72700 [Paractinoplanes deccanensis]|uniref:Uncharacterized protein n=1 Tax=Paractinoplanes deccanensis TaxID=113561 RepID=A0ABQ3YF47_9ACTN|nr:hypothetical protein [Actinoplanes deccanensis]GID78629.1 hypothetical protein Ade02nite_72700 [Actinoplanes deccanensis]
MNKAVRMLTMVGLGLMAGATVGTAPALAADGGSSATAKSNTSTQVQRHDRDQIVGFYRTLRACEKAGRIGEWFDRWEDYDCERVRFGFRRGFWALEVERDWRFGGHGHRDRDFRDRDFRDRDHDFRGHDHRDGDHHDRDDRDDRDDRGPRGR